MIDPDILLAKVATIQRCLQRIHDVTALKPASLDDIDKEDIFVLNLQRAIQATIDIANHVIACEGFKLPASCRESFDLLQRHAFLTPDMAEKMRKMCGFRNIAVHDYQNLSKDILKAILTKHLRDLEDFYADILKYYRMC